MPKSLATLLIGLFFGSTGASANWQVPDKLFHNGNEYYLLTNPLENYFAFYPDKRPKSTSIFSPNLSRGYVATFEIIANELFVTDIVVEELMGDSAVRKSVIHDVFPDQSPYAMRTFGGILTAAYGDVVNLVDEGYRSTFEHYTVFEIKSGKLIKEKSFELAAFEKFKDRQFELFKATEQYKEYLTMMKDSKMSNDEAEMFIKNLGLDVMPRIQED